MDYDADGCSDIVTGSYTGQLYLFRGKKDGGFAQREELKDETGVTMLMPDYSVVPELADMDADGDLDLVVGARTDPVRVIENVGTRSAPVWSKDMRELKTAAGETITGSNPHHADWDGDGVRDLLVGSEWGEVLWYRNQGAENAPSYAPGRVLVERGGFERQQEGATPKRPGQRVKVHVTDWNGDGRADLLVGDVTWQQSIPDPLTPKEEKEKAALEEAGAKLRRKLSRAVDESERKALEAAVEENRTKLRPYNRTKLHTHGWVWLYLRAAER